MTERALLFTDIVDSTHLVETPRRRSRSGPVGAHDRRVRDLLPAAPRPRDRPHRRLPLRSSIARRRRRFAFGATTRGRRARAPARAALHTGAVTLRKTTPPTRARRQAGRSRRPRQTVRSSAERAGGARPDAGQRSRACRPGVGTGARPLAATATIGSRAWPSRPRCSSSAVRGAARFAPPADTDKAYRVVRAGDRLGAGCAKCRHNLPAERDAFIGRAAELRALARPARRRQRVCVTVLGPGGIGKTRFVRRYGGSWLGDWPGGVYFCDLSERARRRHPQRGRGRPRHPARQGRRRGAARPCDRGRGPCLVILDNFEQVLEHAEATLGAGSTAPATPRFVVTSRERLRLDRRRRAPARGAAAGR